MKNKVCIFVIVAAFLQCGISYSAQVAAVSSVSKVTVYQDRALVTRSADVDLLAGENTILFGDLPIYLLEDSLRADGKSVAAVLINGVEIKKTFSPEEANPRIAAITLELEKLQDDLRVLQRKTEALGDQKRFLDSVSNFSSVQIPKEIVTKSSAPSEWTGLSKYMLDSFNENGSAVLENEIRVRQKNKEVEAKQEELNELSQGRNTERKSAMVLVESKENAKFKVELSYLVPQAAWTISYDLKAYPDKKSCALVSYGNVRQWTGEDWKEAHVTLSSAKPVIGGKMPELAPWHVDFFQEQGAAQGFSDSLSVGTLGKAKNKLASKEMVMGARLAEDVPMEIKAEMPQAEVSQELGSVTFEIAKLATIQSDNQSHRFPVKTEDFPLVLDYETTPKLSPYVFIHSKVTNDRDYTLPAGEVSIFVDDNYVAKSSIATVGQGEEFDMYLGIDEGIKVKRTELVDKRKKTMMGLKTRKDYAYQFELENFKKETIAITLIDQIPVSNNAEIKAGLIASSQEPVENKKRPKELGILEWKFQIKPKEKKKLDYQFFIEYPADKQVSGI